MSIVPFFYATILFLEHCFSVSSEVKLFKFVDICFSPPSIVFDTHRKETTAHHSLKE